MLKEEAYSEIAHNTNTQKKLEASLPQGSLKRPYSDENILWYKDAIIYEVHIKAFKDSNGSGTGNFKGLMEKLDYLQDLGVTAIWLLPFYPSPLKDDGYDIADYFSINPSYGTLQDFKLFMKEAKRRGLKVITELVINHTSDQHPWFQRARISKPGSVYRDYYVWSDDPNKFNEVRIIFKDFEASNWTWDPVAKAYYWHRFFHHQPDLNYDNPKVQQEVFRVLDFWFNMGVDGFRLDAVPYLFEREGTNCENLPETHAFLKKLRSYVDSKYKNKLLLAEANMWPEDSASYFGDGDECHMNYHFPLMPRMFMSLKMEDRYPLTDIFDQTPSIPENCQWAMFLRNHDELTLEMVTDEERDYMYRVYTKDPLARINLGIRHRLAPLLDNNRKKIELMNTLLFSLPGTPVMYYGDEIGMGDNYYLGDRDGVRTPMQWSPDRNAGFSKANPQKLYLPLIIDPEYSFESINVETQQKNLSSLLWWNKRVIAMRKRHQAFGRGDIKFLSPSNPKVLAFIRSYKGEVILVVVNLSRFSQAMELELPDYTGYTPTEVFSQNKFPQIKETPYVFTLGPHGYFWFSLEQENIMVDDIHLPSFQEFEIDNWESIERGKFNKILANKILPKYLKGCRWFGGKAKTIQRINIQEILPIKTEEGGAAFFIIEVSYTEDLPELYLLPLSVGYLAEEEKMFNDYHPKSIVASLRMNGSNAILYDAVYDESFRKAVFSMVARKRRLKYETGDLLANVNKEFEKDLKEVLNQFSSKVLNVEQSNTSILFENKFFFKIYRKLDRVINPDLEINRFLTEKTDFAHMPKFVASIEHYNNQPNSQPLVLGLMQEAVPNQGDAWQYICETLEDYFERVLEEKTSNGVQFEMEKFEESMDSELPTSLESVIGGPYVERVNQLGQRTGEMHIALASRHQEKDFDPEPFSLHYQRSLFSSLQSLVRSTFDTLKKNMKNLPEEVREEAEEVMNMKGEILQVLKKIFSKKITTMKIRIHGDYHLGQVLFTGKDFLIIDFEGEPARSFSERRLKRSPLRDVAGMMRSFHYAAYSVLLQNNSIRQEDSSHLEQWAELWYHFVSKYYLKTYLKKTANCDFIPIDRESFDILLETFLLEKAIYELKYELNNRPDWVVIPLRGIKFIMKKYTKESFI
ncbi:MAG TPA: maltose alpha-D-glucosyltransferase [Cytophagales bacterium]|nr:maltose alpha-D-glucosyltransferase [Cytophagales bacterium]